MDHIKSLYKISGLNIYSVEKKHPPILFIQNCAFSCQYDNRGAMILERIEISVVVFFLLKWDKRNIHTLS
jgi:hypothetical protein